MVFFFFVNFNSAHTFPHNDVDIWRSFLLWSDHWWPVKLDVVESCPVSNGMSILTGICTSPKESIFLSATFRHSIPLNINSRIFAIIVCDFFRWLFARTGLRLKWTVLCVLHDSEESFLLKVCWGLNKPQRFVFTLRCVSGIIYRPAGYPQSTMSHLRSRLGCIAGLASIAWSSSRFITDGNSTAKYSASGSGGHPSQHTQAFRTHYC